MWPFALKPGERRALEDFLAEAEAAGDWRRARALLWLHEGLPALDIAEAPRVSRPTVYNWARRFRARPGPDVPARLRDAPRSGRPATVAGLIDPLIEAVIDDDPRGYGYRPTTWTAPLLVRHLRRAHGLEASRRSVGAALTRPRIRWKRPRHTLGQRPHTWRQAKGGLSAG